jgi:uncharacterized protein
LLLGLFVLSLVFHSTARSETDGAKPVEPKRVTIAVLGDSLGDGVWGGLYRKLVRDKRYTVYRGAKNSVGFGGDPLIGQVDKAFAAGPVDAIVMMIGANDRTGIWVNGKLEAPYKSPQWAETYRKRIDDFMDAVAKRDVPLVWVLLPAMREADAQVDATQINDIVTTAAEGRGSVRLVQTVPLTVDGDGRYAAYLKNDKGQSWLARAPDGVHFTDAGYDMLSEAAFSRLATVTPTIQILISQQ